jgi:PPM family protein phosphatase
MRFQHAALTDVGRVRDHNEDTLLADPGLGLYIVADGMGGRAAGEVASQMAVAAIRQHLATRTDVLVGHATNPGATPPAEVARLLGDAVAAASREVYAASMTEADRRGMGTTVTALLVSADRAFLAHVGDSRAYLVRGGRATQMSRDHSLIEELVLAGQITREESKSAELDRLRCVLARAIGVASEVSVDVLDFELLPGDQILLCSDGLTHYVTEEEISAVMLGGLTASVERLVRSACDRGGHDNVTAVALRCESSDPLDVDRLRIHDKKAAALAGVPLLRSLDPRELVHVSVVADTLEFDTGATIMREDQPIPALFVVIEGRIRLARNGRAGVEIGPGGYIGDAALVDRWISAPTAVAVQRSRLARLTRDALISVARREPEVSSKIVTAFARETAERLRPVART